MHYGKKKAIIITSIIIVAIILILGIGGTILYLTTDFLKSNQNLFFKYIEQAVENIEYKQNEQILNSIARMKEEPFVLEGNLNYESEDEMTQTALKNAIVKVEAKVNKPEKIAYAKATLKNNNQDLFKVEYANTDNIYAIKSDEIANVFIGIENQNLKVLAQKLGVTNTSNIPNSITQILNLYDIMFLTESEKSHINETYIPILEKNINKENFIKESNIAVSKENVTYNTTGYRLNLDAMGLKEIETKLLQTLKEDSITLNIITTKAKLLGIDEKYTKIDTLTKEIDNLIKNINSSNHMPQDGITITVYVEKGKVVVTEIIYKNEIKCTVYGQKEENNNTCSRSVIIENLNSTEEYNQIEIKEQDTNINNTTTLNAVVSVDNKKEFEIYLDNRIGENVLNTNCELTIDAGEYYEEDNDEKIEEYYTLKYEQEIEFRENIDEIIKINRNNCAILNDYPKEQLQVLIESLNTRAKEVMKQKAQLLGLTMYEYVEEDEEPELENEIEEDNLEEI